MCVWVCVCVGMHMYLRPTSVAYMLVGVDTLIYVCVWECACIYVCVSVRIHMYLRPTIVAHVPVGEYSCMYVFVCGWVGVFVGV